MELLMFLKQLCRLESLLLANGAARSEFFVSILGTTTLESFTSSHSFSKLDLFASILDVSLVDLPIFLKSFSQLDFLSFYDFVPTDFFSFLHAMSKLDFFSSSVGLAWVDFIFSLSVLGCSTLSGVFISLQSFAQLEASAAVLEAWIDWGVEDVNYFCVADLLENELVVVMYLFFFVRWW